LQIGFEGRRNKKKKSQRRRQRRKKKLADNRNYMDNVRM